MPAISLLLLRSDLDLLVDHVNEWDSVAWLLHDIEADRYRAADVVDASTVAERWVTHLWVKSSALVTTTRSGTYEAVEHPYEGWDVRVPDPPRGAREQQIPPTLNTETSTLRLEQTAEPDDGAIRVSAFQWVGGHYAQLGHAPSAEEKRVWNSLRRWVKKVAGSTGVRGSSRRPLYAFPDAAAALDEGSMTISKW